MKRLRPVSLVAWLGFGSVLIVAVAVTFIALRSMSMLHTFAEREGLMQAQLAAGTAQGFIDAAHESLVASGRLLGRLSGLQRILRARPIDHGGLLAYLTNFCRDTSNVDGCAVLDGDQLLAVAPAVDMPWDDAMAAVLRGDRAFALVERSDSMLYLGASSRVRDVRDGLRTLVLKRVDRTMLDEIGRQVGAAVHVSYELLDSSPPTAGAGTLHEEAVVSRRPIARRLDAPRAIFAGSVPLQLLGETIGIFVDVEVEARPSDALVGDLIRNLGVVAWAVICMAGAAGLIYGRWLVRPVAELGYAAGRIGRGDLQTAVPIRGVPEVVRLGKNMESMRHNLMDLTAELRQREAQTRAVLAGIVEGVLAVDTDRRIRYANPQVNRMLRRPPEDLAGRFCGDVLNPEPVNGVRPCDANCPILAVREGREPESAIERLRAADGSIRSAVVVCAAPLDGQQVLVLRDETETEAARRARDAVLANVTHEFRTPLSAQLASIDLLTEKIEILSAAERKQMLLNVQRGGLRLMRLIDNLLESVRIDAGHLEIRRGEVSLANAIDDAVAMTMPLADQRHQQIITQIPAQLPEVDGDEIRLVQVFVNLLANAVKFAPEASPIRIGGMTTPDSVSIWVENEGPGISDSDRAAVFEPLQRSLQRDPAPPGLGIGLWVVKSIVDRHHGAVDIERTPEGRTRVSVRLPRGEVA